MEHVERVNRTLVHQGSILDIYEDEMELPDGKHETWDFVSHRLGAAAVVPVLNDGRILLVHQYRPALNRMTWEIPAGSRDHVQEDTKICAERELREETGFACQRMEKILSLRTTVAFCDESIDVYLATGLERVGEQQLDEAEAIEIKAFSSKELMDKIYRGEIQDSKTVSGILAAVIHLGELEA